MPHPQAAFFGGGAETKTFPNSIGGWGQGGKLSFPALLCPQRGGGRPLFVPPPSVMPWLAYRSPHTKNDKRVCRIEKLVFGLIAQCWEELHRWLLTCSNKFLTYSTRHQAIEKSVLDISLLSSTKNKCILNCYSAQNAVKQRKVIDFWFPISVFLTAAIKRKTSPLRYFTPTFHILYGIVPSNDEKSRLSG